MIDNDLIEGVHDDHDLPRGSYDRVIDATGCFVLPGVIDEHVHFREPGMTQKADIGSESRAAACGGVTSFFDMPNTIPITTSPAALADKQERASRESRVNYAFFFGAGADSTSADGSNAALFQQIDPAAIPGIKLFLAASTGDMAVRSPKALDAVFQACSRLGLPLMVHSEDADIIAHNAAAIRSRYGDDAPVELHPAVRSAEACLRSTERAVGLALRHGTTLHIAHVSTADELALLRRLYADRGWTAGQDHGGDFDAPLPPVTAEAVVPHLLFSNEDYPVLGALIKCNPAVKTKRDRDALRRALTDGSVATVGTDHAPHLFSEKQGGCFSAASGMPMHQFSLVTMLELADRGILTMERLVALMSHNPARRFSVSGRGFLRPGYKADFVVVRRCEPWTLTKADIRSKCGWSPLEGRQFHWRVEQTFCNGHPVYDHGRIDDAYRGEAIRFRH